MDQGAAVIERKEGAALGSRAGCGREKQAMPTGREREGSFLIYFIFLSLFQNLFQIHFKKNGLKIFVHFGQITQHNKFSCMTAQTSC